MCTNGTNASSESQSPDENSGSVHLDTASTVAAASLALASEQVTEQFYGENLKILDRNSQVAELLTILRDKNTTRSDFKFYADRLIRLVIEESLNQLPYSDCCVETPTGAVYEGLKYRSGNCGVSIIRSGEAMEQGLRDCCRSIRIGKILIESDVDTHVARVVYARFPEDIARRQVLLMYPIMSTGNTVLEAVNVLKQHGVPESCIILSNLFCTPSAANTLFDRTISFEKSQLPPNIIVKFADYRFLSGDAELFKAAGHLFDKCVLVIGEHYTHWNYFQQNIPLQRHVVGKATLPISFCVCCFHTQYTHVLKTIKENMTNPVVV